MENKDIATKFGTIPATGTIHIAYGIAFVQDGNIHYMDSTEHKSYKTAKGFERAMDRMAKFNPALFD